MGKKRDKKYRNFISARSFVRNLELKNYYQWKKFAQSNFLPKDIPTNPEIYTEFQTWENWLGLKENKITKEERLQILRDEYGHKTKRGANLFRGGTSIRPTRFSPTRFSDFMQSGICKDLNGKIIYKASFKQDPEVPNSRIMISSPNKYFKQIREYARSLNLDNRLKWIDHYQKNIMMPGLGLTNPNVSFRNTGWISWGDFLGNYNLKGKKRDIRAYLTYEESSKELQKINKKLLDSLEALNKVFLDGRKKLEKSKLDRDLLLSQVRKNNTINEKGGREAIKELDKAYELYSKELHKAQQEMDRLNNELAINNASDWRSFYMRHRDKMKLVNNKIVPFRPETLYKDKWQGFKKWSGYNLANLNKSILNFKNDSQFDWEKNKKENLMPDVLSPYSEKKVWWKCSKNHSWRSSIRKKIYTNVSCPYCLKKDKIR